MENKDSIQTIEPTVRIGPKHQVTIPAEVFKKLQLETGDFLTAKIKNSEIILQPKKLIPKEQEWFWTKEWQKKEREANEDIKKGRVYGPFTNAKDLIRSLRSKKK